ncbi:MAG: trimeric intracellular cation channel family protein [Dermatophilaceae bacterium]
MVTSDASVQIALDLIGVFAFHGRLRRLAERRPRRTGGGMIRDVLVRQVPEVLQRELYAVPAFAGAALVVLLDSIGLLNPVTTWLCVGAIFVTRMVAVALDLNVPTPPRTATW